MQLSNNEIAEGLVIGKYSVKIHVSNTLANLGMADRVQVVLAWSRLRLDLRRRGPGSTSCFPLKAASRPPGPGVRSRASGTLMAGGPLRPVTRMTAIPACAGGQSGIAPIIISSSRGFGTGYVVCDQK